MIRPACMLTHETDAMSSTTRMLCCARRARSVCCLIAWMRMSGHGVCKRLVAAHCAYLQHGVAQERRLSMAGNEAQVSTYPVPLGSYHIEMGTSQASPEMAGCVALFLQAKPGARCRLTLQVPVAALMRPATVAELIQACRRSRFAREIA